MVLGAIVLYVLICWIVGLLGHKKVMGFWGMFLLSLALTPIVGLLLLITAKKKRRA